MTEEVKPGSSRLMADRTDAFEERQDAAPTPVELEQQARALDAVALGGGYAEGWPEVETWLRRLEDEGNSIVQRVVEIRNLLGRHRLDEPPPECMKPLAALLQMQARLEQRLLAVELALRVVS